MTDKDKHDSMREQIQHWVDAAHFAEGLTQKAVEGYLKAFEAGAEITPGAVAWGAAEATGEAALAAFLADRFGIFAGADDKTQPDPMEGGFSSADPFSDPLDPSKMPADHGPSGSDTAHFDDNYVSAPTDPGQPHDPGAYADPGTSHDPGMSMPDPGVPDDPGMSSHGPDMSAPDPGMSSHDPGTSSHDPGVSHDSGTNSHDAATYNYH